jgi:lauroyl/myristoyl acyltransferase
VYWPDREAYRAWLRQHPGSRVLVTLHMGHYREAFHWLAAEAQAGRNVISLQRELDDTHVHLHRVDERLRQEVHGRELQTPGRVVAALRGGKTTLAVLCDLGPRFGATETVTLFGCPARLVRGPALLALLGGAPLLPFVMLSRGGQDCLLMAPAIWPRLQSGETLAEGVRRITSLLAAHLERWVRMAPEQWRFLPSVGMYLQAPAEEARRGH